ncbi:hypothetical protein [Bradyrhizobium sp. STM 3562]|uniref:hypothetical protein n=1 Tax=Bradyrhizobium sp. STM 3562 TaxID=578924 RepID=UPI00388E5292
MLAQEDCNDNSGLGALAHVTNAMAQMEGDFEKGEAMARSDPGCRRRRGSRLARIAREKAGGQASKQVDPVRN